MKYQGKITDPKDLVTKEYVDTGLSGKLGTSGDGSNVTAAFTAASSRTNISTGEKLAMIFGKIAKWFADLGAAAFRGVDSTVTASSTNLVESGAVKSALDNKVIRVPASGTMTVSASRTSTTIASASDSRITANHYVINAVVSNPSVMLNNWTVVTSAGSLVVNGSSKESTTLVLYLEQ